jgi:hypothetical protein
MPDTVPTKKRCECRSCYLGRLFTRIGERCDEEERAALDEVWGAMEDAEVDFMYERGIIGGKNWGKSLHQLKWRLLRRYLRRMAIPVMCGVAFGIVMALVVRS